MAASILNYVITNRVQQVLKAIETSKGRTVDYFMSMWSNRHHSGVLDLARNAPIDITMNIRGSFVEDKSPETPCSLDWGIIPTVTSKQEKREMKEYKQRTISNVIRTKGKNNLK